MFLSDLHLHVKSAVDIPSSLVRNSFNFKLGQFHHAPLLSALVIMDTNDCPKGVHYNKSRLY